MTDFRVVQGFWETGRERQADAVQALLFAGMAHDLDKTELFHLLQMVTPGARSVQDIPYDVLRAMTIVFLRVAQDRDGDPDSALGDVDSMDGPIAFGA